MSDVPELFDFLPAHPLAADLLAEGCTPCSPMELYTEVFRLGRGVIQRSDEEPGQFKTNPIIIGFDGKRMHREILFEDTFADTLEEFSRFEWAFVSGCSYWGRVNSGERQSKLFALIFDLDSVEPSNVRNFFSGAKGTLYPAPNFLVESGHGLHLYYVLEEPLDLYPNTKTLVKNLKYSLTRTLWNRNTSQIPDPQYQGINQGFRIPGGRTKIPGRRAQAWRFSYEPVRIETLNNHVPRSERIDVSKRWPKTRMSLDEARERFPEWYERIVVRGEAKGVWKVKPALYEWWLNLLHQDSKVSYGHRYFCIMALAIFAAKCGILDRERVKADAMSLMGIMNEASSKHPFTEADVDSALECLDQRYARFPRHDIEKLTAIRIDPNKRNGRKQETHLRGARAIQDIDDPEGTWRNRDGAPTKESVVREWREQHPAGRKIDCHRDTGLSRVTIDKWWKS